MIIRNNLSKKITADKVIISAVIILFLSAVIYFGRELVLSLNNSSGKTTQGILAEPKNTQKINKNFEFPLKNANGEEISKLKFQVESAELRDQIIIKGKRASAVSGKVFLVINLKITSDLNQAIEMKTRNYIRLVVNNNEKELLAPEIHNDPVEVQATSTKYTRVAFAIFNNYKSLKLRVGEPDKEKTVIDLKL